MINVTARDIAAITGGQMVFGHDGIHASSVAIDSRQAESGTLFFAVAGERSDGHRYLADAVDRGATVLYVTDERVVPSLSELFDPERTAVILGSEPVTAIQLLAAHQRRALSIPVVGITGSTGKTSTKQFVTAVLSEQLSVVHTFENQNNELGCPLTILRAGRETQALVVEMGMRGAGQIAELAAIARPTIGVVTNIGPVHIEHLGTVENIARAKGELLEALRPDGLAIVEADGEHTQLLVGLTEARVRMVGRCEFADICGAVTDTNSDGTVRATVSSRAGEFEPFSVHIPVAGPHHLTNALFAVAVGVELGIPTELIARGIERATIPGMRFSTFTEPNTGVTVINDAYNANPTSMCASLETFVTVDPDAPHYALIGDMLELGARSEHEHRSVGELCADLGLAGVFCFGDAARFVADAARDGGVRAAHYSTEEIDRMVDDLWATLHRGDMLLIKGSRGMALERVLAHVTPVSAPGQGAESDNVGDAHAG